MNTYAVKFYVDQVGTYEEQIRAASEWDARKLIQAKFPDRRVRVIQVTRLG